VEQSDAEILDELTTSRGELKVRASFREDKRGQVEYQQFFISNLVFWFLS
jgi:hypothetical protein